MFKIMAFTYISPYVRKYWSKRLWYNRPTTSIRGKLRLRRPKKRLPMCCIRDMNTIRPYRHLERTNYATRRTEAKNILRPKRITI